MGLNYLVNDFHLEIKKLLILQSFSVAFNITDPNIFLDHWQFEEISIEIILLISARKVLDGDS